MSCLTALISSFENASAYLKPGPIGSDSDACCRSAERSRRSGHQNWLVGPGECAASSRVLAIEAVAGTLDAASAAGAPPA